jgi:hypothetical protein
MKSVLLAFSLLLVALSPALAQADVSGLWVADFYGNRVECHIEQRGQYLYGVVYVTTRSGERNTYHVAGLVQGNHLRAQHGGGNYFEGDLENENKASGTFYVKDGPSVAMQAERIKKGRTAPGGLEWPPGYPPAQ